MNTARFNYSFTVRPEARLAADPSVQRLFGVLAERVELDFTEGEFERFRTSLASLGLRLHEVQRVPYLEPEPVL